MNALRFEVLEFGREAGAIRARPAAKDMPINLHDVLIAGQGTRHDPGDPQQQQIRRVPGLEIKGRETHDGLSAARHTPPAHQAGNTPVER
ncbi:MAG: hypothetical protein Q8O33_04605 [Pseudomonadota bacterium]|nr:hypothetical protein [Pseudomonadota bacterium]